MPYYLLSPESIDPGLRRIAKEQIDIGLRDFADATLPEHRKVHSLRIRCKKVRGVLRLVQPIIGDAYLIEDERYRAAAKQLAGNRDDVICARLVAALGGTIAVEAFSPRPIRIEDQRKSLDMLESGRAAVDTWPVALEGYRDIAPGFARTYRKCIEAWEAVRVQPGDELFHRFRRWAKYHWYHIRILERLNKGALRPRRKVLRKLQKTLGDAHDYVLLESFLEQHGDMDNGMLPIAVARKNELYAEALGLGESVLNVSVDSLVADCSEYWANRDIGDPVAESLNGPGSPKLDRSGPDNC